MFLTLTPHLFGVPDADDPIGFSKRSLVSKN